MLQLTISTACCLVYTFHAIVHHFADDTNLLITDKSSKTIKKHTNIDLKLLCNWLKANKISLNSSKTEAILFRHPNGII